MKRDSPGAMQRMTQERTSPCHLARRAKTGRTVLQPYHVPRTGWVLSHGTPRQAPQYTCKTRGPIPILLSGKLRLGEAKSFAQGYAASK